jgi:crotonobetainyl-CoA:carnitine CoA-transferase CaiB-like acyl-CoA transferase
MQVSGMAGDVFSGIRVIELAEWVFIPSAAALLADWGADVIKIEHPERGDGFRGLRTNGTIPPKATGNPAVHFINRGKRSIGLDVQHPQGLEIFHALLEDADVLMTSLLPGALERLGLTAEAVQARYPGLVYVRGHGQGARGPAADIGSFDVTAFWARSGLAATLTTPNAEQLMTGRGGIGDLTASTQAAFGTAAALLRRAATGRGAVVDVSLMAAGMYVNAVDAMTGMQGAVATVSPRVAPPVVGSYRTEERDRWITIAMLQPDKHWKTFCDAIGRSELADDQRFVGAAAQAANADELRVLLAETFASKSIDHWRTALEGLPFPWAPALTPAEAAADVQSLTNGYVADVEVGEDRPLRFLTGAIQFDEQAPTMGRAPLHGEQTDEILTELGFDWDRVIELKLAGAVL